jgi:ubiquinone biosynthesis protein
MERLIGQSAEDVEGMRNAGANLEEFARRGAHLYLEMIFRDGFYHADPHPGNLMLLPGGVIGVLDCGMVGRLDYHLRRDLEDLVLGVLHADADEVVWGVTRLGSVPPELDQEALRAELHSFVDDYSSRSLADLDLGRALQEATDLIRRYHITLPPSCSALLKTLMMLEGTGRQFSPHFSLAELIRPYGARLLMGRFSPRRWSERIGRAYRDWDRLVEALPRDVAEVLQRLRTSTLEVRHRTPRLESAVNRLALSTLAAGLYVAAALMLAHAVAPALWGVSLLGLGTFLAASMLAAKVIWLSGKSD